MTKLGKYRFRLRQLCDQSGNTRSVLIDRKTLIPSVSGSLYEASLSKRFYSPNSVESYLRSAQALISWAAEERFDLDARLLRGEPLERHEVERFALWLETKLFGNSIGFTPAAIDTYNARLRGANVMVRWFVDMFFNGSGYDLPRGTVVEGLLKTSQRAWRGAQKKRAHVDIAPDLDDEHIAKIEAFLRNAVQSPKPQPRWVRAYLIWRLAIEFGFRIGEILALRLEDCPTRTNPAFRIVRIESRTGPPDPRGYLSPRPKTLSRELAPTFPNTVFPRLVVDYQIEDRVRHVRGSRGKVKFRPVLGHQYLVVDNDGRPLAKATASSIARAISREVGVPFTWHLARHAFFNRAYAAVSRLDDLSLRTTRLDDLVFWGGWKDPESLNIYVRRARGERARLGLAAWGSGEQRWKVLG